MRLVRYWFILRSSTGFTRQVGVTAYDYADALLLIKEKVVSFKESPAVVSFTENIDVSTLDANHILPNMAPPTMRGIWYPMGFS